jgi:hypothetical protein
MSGSGVYASSYRLLIHGILAAFRPKIHLSPCPNSPGRPCLTAFGYAARDGVICKLRSPAPKSACAEASDGSRHPWRSDDYALVDGGRPATPSARHAPRASSAHRPSPCRCRSRGGRGLGRVHARLSRRPGRDEASGVLASGAIITLMDMATSIADWIKLGDAGQNCVRTQRMLPAPLSRRVRARHRP